MLVRIAIFSDDLYRAISIMNKLLGDETITESSKTKYYYHAETKDSFFATEVYNPRLRGMRYNKIWIDSESKVTEEMVTQYLSPLDDGTSIQFMDNAIEFFDLEE